MFCYRETLSHSRAVEEREERDLPLEIVNRKKVEMTRLFILPILVSFVDCLTVQNVTLHMERQVKKTIIAASRAGENLRVEMDGIRLRTLHKPEQISIVEWKGHVERSNVEEELLRYLHPTQADWDGTELVVKLQRGRHKHVLNSFISWKISMRPSDSPLISGCGLHM